MPLQSSSCATRESAETPTGQNRVSFSREGSSGVRSSSILDKPHATCPPDRGTVSTPRSETRTASTSPSQKSRKTGISVYASKKIAQFNSLRQEQNNHRISQLPADLERAAPPPTLINISPRVLGGIICEHTCNEGSSVESEDIGVVDVGYMRMIEPLTTDLVKSFPLYDTPNEAGSGEEGVEVIQKTKYLVWSQEASLEVSFPAKESEQKQTYNLVAEIGLIRDGRICPLGTVSLKVKEGETDKVQFLLCPKPVEQKSNTFFNLVGQRRGTPIGKYRFGSDSTLAVAVEVTDRAVVCSSLTEEVVPNKGLLGGLAARLAGHSPKPNDQSLSPKASAGVGLNYSRSSPAREVLPIKGLMGGLAARLAAHSPKPNDQSLSSKASSGVGFNNSHSSGMQRRKAEFKKVTTAFDDNSMLASQSTVLARNTALAGNVETGDEKAQTGDAEAMKESAGAEEECVQSLPYVEMTSFSQESRSSKSCDVEQAEAQNCFMFGHVPPAEIPSDSSDSDSGTFDQASTSDHADSTDSDDSSSSSSSTDKSLEVILRKRDKMRATKQKKPLVVTTTITPVPDEVRPENSLGNRGVERKMKRTLKKKFRQFLHFHQKIATKRHQSSKSVLSVTEGNSILDVETMSAPTVMNSEMVVPDVSQDYSCCSPFHKPFACTGQLEQPVTVSENYVISLSHEKVNKLAEALKMSSSTLVNEIKRLDN